MKTQGMIVYAQIEFGQVSDQDARGLCSQVEGEVGEVLRALGVQAANVTTKETVDATVVKPNMMGRNKNILYEEESMDFLPC